MIDPVAVRPGPGTRCDFATPGESEIDTVETPTNAQSALSLKNRFSDRWERGVGNGGTLIELVCSRVDDASASSRTRPSTDTVKCRSFHAVITGLADYLQQPEKEWRLDERGIL